MFNFFVTYTLKDEATRGEFIKAILENQIGAKSRAEKGCFKYDYYIPVEEDNVLFLHEQWDTLEDQEVHTHQDHFAKIQELEKIYGAEVELVQA